VIDVTDVHGQVVPWIIRQDYAFKFGVIASQEERGVAPMESSEPGTTIVHAEGAVLFVQYDDGTTWGDPQAGEKMLAARPQNSPS
jgi:hypothetical protein